MGEKPGLWRRLLRPLHRPARRRRQDAANVPCEGNVQCQDGSLTLYAGAKSPERRQGEQLAAREWPVPEVGAGVTSRFNLDRHAMVGGERIELPTPGV